MHFISQDDIELDDRHISINQILTLEDIIEITNQAGYINAIAINPESMRNFYEN